MKPLFVADLVLIIVTFIWGTTFIVVQDAVHFLPPLAFNSIRFFMASLFLLMFLLFLQPIHGYLTKDLLRDGGKIGVWLFAGYALQTAGLQYTTTAKSGFITGLSVILVPFFAYLVLKQIPNFKALLGVLFSGTGLYLLTGPGSLTFNIGDFYTLLCAVAFALHITFTGRYAPRYQALPLAWVQITSVSLFSFMGSILFEKGALLQVPGMISQPEVVWGLATTSILATAVAFFAQTICQKYTKATHVALIFTMEPVFAGLTAFLYRHEVFTPFSIMGSLLILIGMVFAEWPTKKKKSGSYPLISID